MRPTAEDRADARVAPAAAGTDPKQAASADRVARASAAGPEQTPTTGAEQTPTAGPERAPAPGADLEPARAPRAGRLLAWLAPGANPAGAIYGMLAIGALLAAESGLRDTYAETVGSALVALALYWLAHAYADLLGQRLQTRERLTAAALRRNLLHDWAIMRGGALPLLVLVLCWTAGASQETAVTVDLWITAGSLVAFELLAGLRARARPGELLLEGCVGATMGLGVLVLRVLLH
jgi:hypothetical protein